MATIQDLPNELVLKVLKFARNDPSAENFINCVLCCKRWGELGLEVLYEVCAATRIRAQNGAFVRSLRLLR